jgi:uncharacterized protein YjbI with pentapeptide repeats
VREVFAPNKNNQIRKVTVSHLRIEMDTQNETEVTAEDYDAALALVLEEHRRWKNGPTGERERGRRLDLCGANLNGADLRGASLRQANLGGAYLANATLTGAELSGASLLDAEMLGTIMPDGTIANELPF